MSDDKKKANREPREGETLCRYDCGTIVAASLGSCEMCCPEACAEREAKHPTEASEPEGKKPKSVKK